MPLIKPRATGRLSRPPVRQETGFSTQTPSALKAVSGFVDAMLYDCSSPVSGASEDTYFQVPIGGQLSGNSAVKKSLLHTNMKQGGQLPTDESFEVRGYGMWITPLLLQDTDQSIVRTLFNNMINGYVTIKFRGMRDLDYPISALLSYRPAGIIGTSTNNFMTLSGSALNFAKGFKPLSKPFILSRAVPVEVKVEWPTAPNSGSSNPILLYFAFFGIREFALVS